MAALSLAAMSIGVPGFMLSRVLLSAFYARQDTRTPMRAAIFTVLGNVSLMAVIVTPLWLYTIPGAHAGIALATGLAGLIRSEEHTSELQSLMRISYSVFCLKKKK